MFCNSGYLSFYISYHAIAYYTHPTLHLISIYFHMLPIIIHEFTNILNCLDYDYNEIALKTIFRVYLRLN